jgi:DNA-binding MarR family transcriptional regulator
MTSKRTAALSSSITPIDSPCNLFYIRRAARAVSRQYSLVMKVSGLQGPQFSVLSILNISGPQSISDLAAKMGLDRTSMSRNLIPLQKAGLIFIGDEGWHRVREVSLTEEGRQTLSNAMPMWQQAQAHFIEHMGQEDTALLIALLRRAASIDFAES